MNTKLSLTALLLLTSCILQAQDFVPKKKWADSISVLVKDIYGGLRLYLPQIDSLAKARLQNISHPDITGLTKIKRPKIQTLTIQLDKPAVRFGGGYIDYNGMYRSALDTPFKEENIFQHLITGRLDFTLKNTIPLTLSYFERESNSMYFRDYRDFKIEFNAAEFQKLKTQRLQTYVSSLSDALRNPLTAVTLDYTNNQLLALDELLNQSAIINKVIGSRISITSNGISDTTGRDKDSVVLEAKEFLAFYDSVKFKLTQLEKYRDSLQSDYVKTEKQILSLKKLLSGNSTDEEKRNQLEALLIEKGIDPSGLQKFYGALISIRKFGIGRVNPNYSDLTLKNINVKGIDFEYNRKIYFALTAGVIDFKARDFFYSKHQTNAQFIYAGRFGYGSKEGTHMFLTGYKGKKQLLSTSPTSKSSDVYGLSFEYQLLLSKNHRFIGEISQSVSPELVSLGTGNEKSTFDLNDRRNKAYSLRLNSLFPKMGSKLDAFYQYRGINFQSFTSYYSNSVLNSWQVKASQYFWKKRISINASVAKNTFENPNVLTRYNGNTVFKNLSVSIRSPKGSSLSFGYMPSSQLSEVGGQVYENYFQSLNFNISHSYKVGVARALSLLSYNRFYNDSRDSGFVYFNAQNLLFSQNLQFLSYSATINIARTASTQYTLTTLDAAVNARVFKRSQFGLGVKINQLNNQDLKVGIYGSERIVLPKLGEVHLSIEKSYLPSIQSGLVRSDLYTIGYTRYFN